MLIEQIKAVLQSSSCANFDKFEQKNQFELAFKRMQ